MSNRGFGRPAAVGRTRSPIRVLGRARELVRSEGLSALVTAAVRRYVIDSRTFFLYEHYHRARSGTGLVPRPEGFDECLVEGNEAADSAAAGHNDFRDTVPGARRALECGAVALCIYHGRDVAHVGWLATSSAARRALDRLGYEVRFDRGESWTGAAFTAPRFRNRGLLTYSCQRRFEYLLSGGFAVSRAAVATDNAASHHVTMRFEPRVYAIGRQLRILRWRKWTERPVTPSDLA
jgi:hypothetical protein